MVSSPTWGDHHTAFGEHSGLQTAVKSSVTSESNKTLMLTIRKSGTAGLSFFCAVTSVRLQAAMSRRDLQNANPAIFVAYHGIGTAPPDHRMAPRSCALSTIPWGKRPHGAGRTLEPDSSNQIFRAFQPKNPATKIFQQGIFLPTGLDQNPNLTETRGDIRFTSTVFSPTRGLP